MLYAVVPQGDIVRVTNLFGRQSDVIGPAVVPFWNRMERFKPVVIGASQRATVTTSDGREELMIGPARVQIEPQGAIWFHERHSLAAHEAVVVIGEDGRRRVMLGKDTPVVWVGPNERLHTFRWSGSKGDTEVKTPGVLQIQVLRLQATQTYVSYRVRTKDNMVADVRLMLSYSYADVDTLLINDDPLGAMYNRIMADIVRAVAEHDFDHFKANTATVVTGIPLFQPQGREFFRAIGIDFTEVILREWQPVDRSVQAILEKAATTNAQKAVDDAEHQRLLQKLADERARLEEEKTLADLRRQAAEHAAQAEGAAINALYNIIPTAAMPLALMTIASRASTLTISNELLRG